MKSIKADKPFLFAVIILVVGGFFIFSSASMGLMARDGASFSQVAFSQIFFGIFLGAIAFFITSNIDYKFWRKYSPFLFLASIIATLLVFVPHLGFEHGGAKRWILIGSFTFQTSELLKIGYIIFLAFWISKVKDKIKTIKYGIVPFVLITAVAGGILLKQPDTDTFLILFTAGLAMLITAGAKWRHILLLLVTVCLGIILVAFLRPYVMQRIDTFLHPEKDSLGASYQIQQSLIAIGSGGLSGRGFGQSIQKFSFLPEPIGDSIFAVASEEFGFVGATGLIALFVFLAFRGLKIAKNAPDLFGGLMCVGIVILIISQSFINIGAMLGVLPLSGIPLLFVSHGGTALLITLAEVGIIANISKRLRA